MEENLGKELAAAPKFSSIGRVQLGANKELVVNSLGQPAETHNSLTEAERLDYPNRGLVVWLENNKVKMVESTRDNPKGLALKLGDDEKSLRSVLGSPLKKSPADQDGEFWSYPKRGLSVVMKKGIVAGFMVGESR